MIVKATDGGLHGIARLDTTGMIINMELSTQPKWSTADGSAHSIWLSSSICRGTFHCLLSEDDVFLSARTSNSLQSLRCISILRSPSLIFMLFGRCATRLLWVPKLCMHINMLRFALAHLVPLLLQLVHSLFSGSLGWISCISLYLAWSSLISWPSRPWSLITVMNLGHDLSLSNCHKSGSAYRRHLGALNHSLHHHFQLAS